LGAVVGELWVWRREAGWVVCGDAGFAPGRRGHSKLERPRGGDWVSSADDSASDLVMSFCCVTDSRSDRRSEACCCCAARRKLLATVMESESLSIGSLRLDVILSISVVDIEEARASSPRSRIKKATARRAVSASGESLKESTTEKIMLASLFLEYCSLAKIQPFFSNQARASFSEETGLVEAASCASRSALGERVLLPVDRLLLEAPRVELRGTVFALTASPMVSKGDNYKELSFGWVGIQVARVQAFSVEGMGIQNVY
jgi:hypothetical protein